MICFVWSLEDCFFSNWCLPNKLCTLLNEFVCVQVLWPINPTLSRGEGGSREAPWDFHQNLINAKRWDSSRWRWCSFDSFWSFGDVDSTFFFCGWGVGFCSVCVSLGTKKIKLCEVAKKSISPTKSNIESATGSGVRQDVWKEIEGQVEEDTLFIDWSTNPTDVPPPEIRPYDQGLLTIGFQ